MKKSVVVLLHIGYWVMYLFLITMLFMIANMDKRHITLKLWGLVLFFRPFGFAAILPALFGFYTFYSVLFDKYLTKEKNDKIIFISTCIRFNWC